MKKTGKKSSIGMGAGTKKLLKSFIESLQEKALHKKNVKPVVMIPMDSDEGDTSSDEPGQTGSKTERRIRALWENLKQQLTGDEEQVPSPEKKAVIVEKQQSPSFTPPPQEEPQAQFSLREASSPALGRRVGENTKKRVKNILDNMKKAPLEDVVEQQNPVMLPDENEKGADIIRRAQNKLKDWKKKT